MIRFVKRELWKAVHGKTSSQFEDLRQSLRALDTHQRRSARTLLRRRRAKLGASASDIQDCCCFRLSWYYFLHHHMHPESTFRHIWTILAFFGIAFNAFSVPTAVAFMFSGTYTILVPAIIVDLFFIVDICLNLTCFTYYDTNSGVVETRTYLIRQRYRESSSFRIDVIAALPLDFLALAAPDTKTSILILPLLLHRLPFLPPL